MPATKNNENEIAIHDRIAYFKDQCPTKLNINKASICTNFSVLKSTITQTLEKRKIPPEEKAYAIRSTFDESGLTWFCNACDEYKARNDNQEPSFEEIVEKATETFGNVQTAFNTLNELQSRTPDFNKPNDMIQLFTGQIDALNTLTKDQYQISLLLSKLPYDLRQHVKDRRPTTFAEAAAHASHRVQEIGTQHWTKRSSQKSIRHNPFLKRTTTHITCNLCHKLGHIAKDCYHNKRNNHRKNIANKFANSKNRSNRLQKK